MDYQANNSTYINFKGAYVSHCAARNHCHI